MHTCAHTHKQSMSWCAQVACRSPGDVRKELPSLLPHAPMSTTRNWVAGPSHARAVERAYAERESGESLGEELAAMPSPLHFGYNTFHRHAAIALRSSPPLAPPPRGSEPRGTAAPRAHSPLAPSPRSSPHPQSRSEPRGRHAYVEGHAAR